MNMDRVDVISEKSTKHATYIMLSSFRILDNHSLYFALNKYETIDILICRTPEDKRQNDYFAFFISDLIKKLGQFGNVSIVYDYKKIQINNDIVMDKAYLLEEKEIEAYVIKNSHYSLATVESNVVVPVLVTSNKEEYAARTIRSKIHKHLNKFIDPVLEDFDLPEYELFALGDVKNYIKTNLKNYDLKNHPEFNYTSGFSKYLKYGIVSPLRILILLGNIDSEIKESFVEELVVRRELAYNFVYFNSEYNVFSGMTYEWAYKTMDLHKSDVREYLYDVNDYISFNTHDKYFNAAMKEMVYLGTMHGYMRMYWCKKIMEWSKDAEFAYETAIFLNNKYFLDGNTPNGYTGVAWCFGKHDRAWKERQIFGKLRYMNENGLKRKFDIDKYIERIDREVLLSESSKAGNTD